MKPSPEKKSAAVFAFVKELVGRFRCNNCTMHAAGLTYFSLLAVVPALCILLFAAKVCNVHEYAEKALNGRIDALIVDMERGGDDDPLANVIATGDEEARARRRETAGEFAREARKFAGEIFDRVDKFNVGTLGWVGFAFLLWTVVSSIGMVEVSFNGIWGVGKPRGLCRRIWLYLVLALLMPPAVAASMSLGVLAVLKNAAVVVFGSTGLTEWLAGWVVALVDAAWFRLMAMTVSASAAFAFVYWVIPNCKVCFRHAFIGGAVTAVFFGGWMKLCAVAQVGIAKSSALYGSFAFFPILLAWVYMSWQIVLFGACLTRTAECFGKGDGK